MIFYVFFFLIGDSSILSKWKYKENSTLAILMVLFSLLIVVYLMNLLIGLLNNAIEKDNNRVSYFIQKAEVIIIKFHNISSIHLFFNWYIFYLKKNLDFGRNWIVLFITTSKTSEVLVSWCIVSFHLKLLLNISFEILNFKSIILFLNKWIFFRGLLEYYSIYIDR